MKLKAEKTPYSSVVGGGLTLVDYKGRVRFNVMICGAAEGISKEQDEEISRQLMDGFNNTRATPAPDDVREALDIILEWKKGLNCKAIVFIETDPEKYAELAETASKLEKIYKALTQPNQSEVIRDLAGALRMLHHHNANMGETGIMDKGEYISWDLGEAYCDSHFFDKVEQALTKHEQAIKKAGE